MPREVTTDTDGPIPCRSSPLFATLTRIIFQRAHMTGGEECNVAYRRCTVREKLPPDNLFFLSVDPTDKR